MSEKINDGGPAFPQPQIDNQGRIDSALQFGEGGMTLRDYFAAKAMQGMSTPLENPIHFDTFASRAYLLPDAMIAARTLNPHKPRKH